MAKTNSALKLLLLLFCIANVVLGAMGLMGGAPAVKAAAVFYGASVNLNPQLDYVVRMLGAFVFTMGILGGIAALDPVKNKAIINGVILLLILRVAQRVFLAKEISAAFGITSGRNLANIIFFLAIAAALFLLKPKAER